jgi:hypothetical protein
MWLQDRKVVYVPNPGKTPDRVGILGHCVPREPLLDPNKNFVREALKSAG